MNIISSPGGGGAEMLVRELHKRYLSAGLDSTVVYFNSQQSPLGHNERSLDAGIRDLKNIFKLRELIKAHAVSGGLIVHAHLTWPFFFVAIATLFLDVTLVYTEHNTTNKRRRIPLLWMLERLFYSRYKTIICISDGVRESLAKWVGKRLSKRLVTISNGARIYELAQRPSLFARKPRLVSIGSLTRKKGFATALHAVAKLRGRIHSYTIVGEGSERPGLETLVKRLQLQDTVILAGWSDDIEGHLHNADIQLIPSLWEGFGLSAVEGMSTGLPVIASDVSGLRDVLNPPIDSVLVVKDFKSAEAWACQISQMIERLSSDNGKMADISRKQAEKFTLDAMTEKYIQVYQDL
jgi:glycosyltransferase involved in cell wall biosynthesis